MNHIEYVPLKTDKKVCDLYLTPSELTAQEREYLMEQRDAYLQKTYPILKGRLTLPARLIDYLRPEDGIFRSIASCMPYASNYNYHYDRFVSYQSDRQKSQNLHAAWVIWMRNANHFAKPEDLPRHENNLFKAASIQNIFQKATHEV